MENHNVAGMVNEPFVPRIERGLARTIVYPAPVETWGPETIVKCRESPGWTEPGDRDPPIDEFFPKAWKGFSRSEKIRAQTQALPPSPSQAQVSLLLAENTRDRADEC
jgi:hypothetical protein